MARITPATLAALALVPILAHAAPTYRVTPVKDGQYSMSCNALNARGDVAGTAVTDIRAEYGYDAVVVAKGRAHSVGWSHGQLAAQAGGINIHRQVVGSVIIDQAFGFTEGTVWSADGQATRLRSPRGSSTEANGLNDAGDIVGSIEAGGSTLHATVWIDGTPTELAPDWSESDAYAVNNRRQATGWVRDTALAAALFDGGAVVRIGSLGGNYAWGYAINQAGHVAGYSTLAGDGAGHAFLYANGTLQDLGAPAGKNSQANGINADDVIVGQTYDGVHVASAVVWVGGQMSVLDDLLDPATGQGWKLFNASAINDAGQICADGNKGAALLTPM